METGHPVSHATNVNVLRMAHDLYAAYNASCGGKNYQGLPCPTWQALPPAVRGHWYVVALRALEMKPTDDNLQNYAAGEYSLGHLPDPMRAYETWGEYLRGDSVVTE